MANQLEEVLSRLQISGASSVGGSAFANYLAVLNSTGQLDSSLFSSTLNVYTTYTSLGSIPSPKSGEVAVVNGAAYVYNGTSWVNIGYANASGIPFDPTSTPLISTNVQAAVTELANEAVLTNSPATITAAPTFDTGGAPFIVGTTSSGIRVPGLNADKLDGQDSTYFTNAANLSSGILPPERLSGSTPYAISISGTAAYAIEAASASAADTATTAQLAYKAVQSGLATSLANGAVTTITLSNGGSNYTVAPNVVVTLGSGDTTGTGLAATAVIASGSVVAVNITNPGTLYTAVPVISFTRGSGDTTGAGAAATASSPVTASGGNASELGGQLPAYYTNASNLAAGNPSTNTGCIPTTVFSDISHGTRAGGTLHAEATTTTAGFLSAADKSKLISAVTSVPDFFNTVIVGSTTFNADATTTIGGSNSLTFGVDGSGILTVTPTSPNTITFGINSGGLSSEINTLLGESSVLDNYVSIATPDTITATHVFNPTTTGAPFSLGARAQDPNTNLVQYLNAQYFNSHTSDYYLNIANLTFSGGSYPTWLTGAVAGAISGTGISPTSVTTTGAVSANSLTTSGNATIGGNLYLSSYAPGSGLTKILGINGTTGLITTSGVTADDLASGSTNKFATTSSIFGFLAGSPAILQNNSARGGIAWTAIGSPTYSITGQIVQLYTSDILDPSGLYVSAANVDAVLEQGTGIILDLETQLIIKLDNTAATGNALIRTGTNALTDNSLTIALKNIDTTAGSTTSAFGTGGATSAATLTQGASTTQLTTQAYVTTALAAQNGPAITDLPILTTAQVAGIGSTYTPVIGDVVLGTGATVDGVLMTNAVYYVYNNDVNVGTYTWTPINLGAVTLTNDVSKGTITGPQLGQLIKAASLTESQASAPIFLPSFRLSEPRNAGTDYGDAQWKKYFVQSVQTRGQATRNYFVMLRVRGWVDVTHNWSISYQQFNGTTNVTKTAQVNAGMVAQVPTGVGSSPVTYLDLLLPLIVAGRSAFQLSLDEMDGDFGDVSSAVFPGVAPYGGLFEGTFVYLQAEGVSSLDAGKPFNPYTPDLLWLQSDGEAVSGGLSNYAALASIYDGEVILDSQTTTLAYKTDPPTSNPTHNPNYILANPGDAVSKYEKIDTRCNYSIFNKLSGFNGFLRPSNVVLSPNNFSGPLIRTGELTDGSAVYLNNGGTNSNRLTADITGTLDLSKNDLDYPGSVTFNTGDTLAKLLGLPASVLDFTTDGNISVTYDPPTDRITIHAMSGLTGSSPYASDYNGDVQYGSPMSANAIFETLRIGFGRGTNATYIGISLPVASGIRTSDTLANLNLRNSINFVTSGGYDGSFGVDGNVIYYHKTDTFFPPSSGTDYSLYTQLKGLGYELDYITQVNQLSLKKINQSDDASLLPPRVFDISGSLMQSLGLETLSFGNQDLPSNSVHNIVYQESASGADAVWVGGSFKNFGGANSAGLVKLSLNGKIAPDFSINPGFDKPVRTIALLDDSTTDAIVAGLEPVGLNGFNKKPFLRLLETGVESSVQTSAEADISLDNQNKVLDIISLPDGYFLVLTPLSLQVRSPSGALVNNYPGTKGFHGMTRYKDDTTNGITSFLVASQAYSSPTVAQTLTLGSVLQEPLGLRLLNYNYSDHTVSYDTTWKQAGAEDGAGTGAEASCAYPVVGTSAVPYAVCANSGTFWGSGLTSFPGNVAWNQRPSGNLLYYSQTFNHAPGSGYDNAWYVGGTGLAVSTSHTDAFGKTYYTVTTSVNGDVAYLQQTIVQSTLTPYVGTSNSNTGGQSYVLNIDVGQTSGSTTYAYIGLNLGTSDTPLTEAIAVGVVLNTNTGSFIPVGVTGTSSATATTSLRNSNAWTVNVTVTDTTPGNYYVSPIIYPAYSSSFSSAPGNYPANSTGINIYCASLVYGQWNTNYPWPDGYVPTTTSPVIPSAPIATNFTGLYKIALESGTVNSTAVSRGKGWPGFSTCIVTDPAQVQTHPIVFGVDSSDNIYLGGPVTQISSDGTNGNFVDVTPWRLYRVTSAGHFDKEYLFDDVVTSCCVTPYDQLIVGGKFNCYNRIPASKLVFLDNTMVGNVLDTLATTSGDVIISVTTPSVVSPYTANKLKLWLNTGVVPPMLNVYDTTTNSWVDALDGSRRLPAPTFNTLPANGGTTNVTSLLITVPGFNVYPRLVSGSPNAALASDPLGIYIQYYMNGSATPIDYDPVAGISSSITSAGNYTIAASASSTYLSTVTGSTIWLPSSESSMSFTVQAKTQPPTFNGYTSGSASYSSITITAPAYGSDTMNIWYLVLPANQTAPTDLTTGTVNTTGTGNTTTSNLATIAYNSVVYAQSQETGHRPSAIVSLTVGVSLNAPTIAYTGPSAYNITITNPSGQTGAAYGILYSLDGTVPTINNYNAQGGTGSIQFVAYSTANPVTIPVIGITYTSNQVTVKASSVYFSGLAANPTFLAESWATTTAATTYTRFAAPGLTSASSSGPVYNGTVTVVDAGPSQDPVLIPTSVLKANTTIGYEVVSYWIGSASPTNCSLSGGGNQTISISRMSITGSGFATVNVQAIQTSTANGTYLPSAIEVINVYLSEPAPNIQTIYTSNGTAGSTTSGSFIYGFAIIPNVPLDLISYSLNPNGAFSTSSRIAGGSPTTAGATNYAYTLATAKATATFVNSTTITAAVTNAGALYGSAPTVTVSGGGGTCSSHVATIVNGSVTAVTLTGCTGYTSAPTITIAAPFTSNSVKDSTYIASGIAYYLYYDTIANAYLLPIIGLEVATANNTSSTFTVFVDEYVLANNPNQDGFTSYNFNCYTIPATFTGLYSLPDHTYLTEGSSANIITYDTTGNVLGLAESTTQPFNDAGSTVCRVAYNLGGVVQTSGSSYENTFTSSTSYVLPSASSGSYPAFTPTTTDVTNPGSQGVGISLRFFAPNKLPSRQVTINVGMRLPAVTFSPTTANTAREYTVTISNSLNTAEIYYTLDGTAPTNQSLLYDAPLDIRSDTTITAVAYKSGWIAGVAASPYTTTSAGVTGAPSTSYNNESAYKLVNITCGTPLDETELTTLTAAPTAYTITKDSSSTFSLSGTSTIENLAELVKAPVGDAIAGLTTPGWSPGIGYITVGYWNVINSLNNESWFGVHDALGSRNANGSLSIRKFFEVDEAPKFFGVSGNSQITNYTDGSNITCLENTALTSEVSAGTMIEVDGLAPSKYLLLAYGEKTQFDLIMNSGTCLSQNTSNPAFYNYGSQLYSANYQQNYNVPVIPVYTYKVIAVARTPGNGAGTTLGWVVDTSSKTSVFVPASWYQNKLASTTTLSNELFIDTSGATVSTKGIVYVPTSATDGLAGYLGDPGSLNVPYNVFANTGNQEVYGTSVSEATYYNTVYTTQDVAPVYGWSSGTSYSIPDFTNQTITYTNSGGPSSAIKLGAVDAPQPSNFPARTSSYAVYPVILYLTEAGVTGGFYAAPPGVYAAITVVSAGPTINPAQASVTVYYMPAGQLLVTTGTFNYVPTGGTWGITGYQTTTTASHTIGATRTSISNNNTVSFSSGWEFVAFVVADSIPISGGGSHVVDLTEIYTAAPAALTNISLSLSKILYAPDINNVSVASPFTDVGPQSTGTSYSPTTLDHTAAGLKAMLLGDFNESLITGMTFNSTVQYPGFGLQVINNDSYQANSANLTGNITTGATTIPLQLVQPPEPLSGNGPYTTDINGNYLYCMPVTNSSVDLTKVTNGTINLIATSDATNPVTVAWYVCDLDSSGNPVGRVLITSAADYTGPNYSVHTTNVAGQCNSSLTLLQTLSNPPTNKYYFAILTAGGVVITGDGSVPATKHIIGVTGYDELDGLTVNMVSGGVTYTTGSISVFAGSSSSSTMVFTANLPADPTYSYNYLWMQSINGGTPTSTTITGHTLTVVASNGGSGLSGTTLNIDNSVASQDYRYFVQVSNLEPIAACSTSGLNNCCDMIDSSSIQLGCDIVSAFSISTSVTGPVIGSCLFTAYDGSSQASLNVSVACDPADASHISYEWQSAPHGTTDWATYGTTIGTASSYSFSSPVHTLTDYRCVVTDGGSIDPSTTTTGTWSYSVYDSILVDNVVFAATATGGIDYNVTPDKHEITNINSLDNGKQVTLYIVNTITSELSAGLHYQWYASFNGGTYTPVATSASYVLESTSSILHTGDLSAAGTYRYYATVSTDSSFATCDTISLITNPIVVIVT